MECMRGGRLVCKRSTKIIFLKLGCRHKIRVVHENAIVYLLQNVIFILSRLFYVFDNVILSCLLCFVTH